MNIQSVNNQQHVTLSLEGRLDTAAAQLTSEAIDAELAKCAEIEALTLDAEQLEYISSSGLRILLGLAKRFKNFKVIGAQPEVYRVLEMTGFIKMMSVERALRRLSIDGCQIIGRGGVGVVYRLDDDTIIKVFREGTTPEEINTEVTMAKEAFVLGMPTAISFDMVRVGNQYGLVYELLRADTLSAVLMREPERLDEFARKYAELFRQLHSIKVPAGSNIPSVMVREEQAVRHISRYFDTASTDLMLTMLNAIPQGDRLLHCDLQTKNAMMQGDDLMLIDMGEVGYGHPIIDLSHAYSAMVKLVGDYQTIIGMPKELANKMFDKTLDYYFADLSPELQRHRREQIDVLSRVRNFSWLSLSDSFPQEVISECQQLFTQIMTKQKDYILDVCSTFGDWELD